MNAREDALDLALNTPVEMPSSLEGGGDCFGHYHSSDRLPTHDTRSMLNSLEREVTVTADYTVKSSDDYIIGDTTGGNLTITLPEATRGRRITILKSVAANTLTVASASNVNGVASVNLATQWSVLSLKASRSLGWVNG